MSNEIKLKILVAEDNNINIQVARYILSPIASELHFVMNGKDAVDYFLKNRYDIILMDVKMPVMDGYEATGEIRRIESERSDNKKIPIVAMTANNMYEEIQTCLQAGMDGFLSKPFTTDDVRNILKTIDHHSVNGII